MSDFRGVHFCRSCDSRSLFVGLDLGSSPIANRLQINASDQMECFPLVMRVCSNCGMGQLQEFQLPETLFSDYPYLSSTSETWLAENKAFAAEVANSLQLNSEDLVVEIASNDGYLLNFFKLLGMRVLGIEPAPNVAGIAEERGIQTIVEFFGLKLAQSLVANGYKPKTIIAKNVLAHVPDIQDFVKGIEALASNDSVIVIEAPTILQILNEMQFDTIYHEHFSYLSATGVQRLFQTHGLELVGTESVSTHGGSIRFFARKSGGTFRASLDQALHLERLLAFEKESGLFQPEAWENLQSKVKAILTDFQKWLNSSANGIRTIGYGAAAKGVTLLASAGAVAGDIDFVIDNSIEKAGKFLPVVSAPIILEDDYLGLKLKGPCRFVIFPWNLSNELSMRIRSFDPTAEIIRAIPRLEILP